MTKSDDKRVPVLRFKGFTDEWEQHKLNSFLVEYKKKTKINNQYPVLTSSRQGIFFQKDYYDGNQIASKNNIGYNIVPRNYFTYRHMSDDTIFHFNINTLCDYGIVSTLYPVFTTNNQLSSSWLYYYLNYGNDMKRYALLQKQGSSRTYMYLSKLKNMSGHIPSVKEQDNVAKMLLKIDNLIALQQRKLKLLKLMKNIVSYNLVVSHKLASNNEIKWKAVYLKDIARIYQSTTITKKDLLPKGIPVFGANDYIGFYNKYNHETDQVTICARGASAGHPNYVKGPVWITGNSMVINVDETYINKKFLYTLLTFTDLKRFVTGGAQPQITRENLNSLKILLPSIKAQNNLSAIIENLSINIRKVQLSINSAKRLKQFLLQNMFI